MDQRDRAKSMSSGSALPLKEGAGPALKSGATASMPGMIFRRPGGKTRVALIGTGARGINMWGRSLARDYGDQVEFAALCDLNPGRLEYARQYMEVDCPTYPHTAYDRMIAETEPRQIIVCTTDNTHHDYVIAGMHQGCDIISEKPLSTDEIKCQAILDATQETGRADAACIRRLSSSLVRR
jgi:predicted dehydrogenase